MFFTHEDDQLAPRVPDTGGPPLAAIDHVLVAFAADLGFDVGGIGRSDSGFRHRETGAYPPLQQRLQPALLLRRRAVARQDLHVPAVGRGAVEDLRRDRRTTHDFGQWRVVAVVQSGPVPWIGQAQIPQSLCARAVLELLHQGRCSLVSVRFVLVPEPRFGGVDMCVHEAHQLRLQGLRARGGFEVHDEFLSEWLCMPSPSPLRPSPRRGCPPHAPCCSRHCRPLRGAPRLAGSRRVGTC